MLPYRGFGTSESAWFSGRVVEDGGVTPVHPDDTPWTNLRNTVRRFWARPIAHARVLVRLGEHEREVTTDGRGFFEVRLPTDGERPPDGWLYADVILLDPHGKGATGRVFVPPDDATLAIVSDVDDTILRTWAFDKLRMVTLLLFENARTRVPFHGVGAFYTALQAGTSGTRNPVFYVSSSAWNLYDLLHDFVELNGLPAGPILLRDMRFTRASLFGGRRHDHKLTRIRTLMATYPDLPFVLVGDTGQRDPELYREIVIEHPGRVRAVYLRDVVRTGARRAAIDAIADDVRHLGTEVLLVADTLDAARHAAERGWILPETLGIVAEDRDADEAQD